MEPVAPGTLSFMVDNTFKLGGGLYMVYVWRCLGWKGFASKAILPLAGIMVGHRVTLMGMNYLREGVYSIHRKVLVEEYA